MEDCALDMCLSGMYERCTRWTVLNSKYLLVKDNNIFSLITHCRFQSYTEVPQVSADICSECYSICWIVDCVVVDDVSQNGKTFIKYRPSLCTPFLCDLGYISTCKYLY